MIKYIHCNLVKHDIVWYGMPLCGLAWRGVAWRGVAWRGVAWRGVAWCGVAVKVGFGRGRPGWDKVGDGVGFGVKGEGRGRVDVGKEWAWVGRPTAGVASLDLIPCGRRTIWS